MLADCVVLTTVQVAPHVVHHKAGLLQHQLGLIAPQITQREGTGVSLHLSIVEDLLVNEERLLDLLSQIDGAHAPGQIDLDMQAIGADFYTGNCHKWLCAPKGAGFLHVRRAVQHMVQPLVVSWGWGPERGKNSGNDFVDMLEWQGTDDFAAYLTVPAAIDFQTQHDWPQQRHRCNALLRRTLAQISHNNGLPLVYLPTGADAGGFAVGGSAALAHLPPQLGVASLPESFDLAELRTQLYDRHHIEIPLVRWRGRQFVRLSVQVYTSEAECATLVQALA